jgi:hypothetical protein
MSLNYSDIQLDCPKHTQIMGMLGWVSLSCSNKRFQERVHHTGQCLQLTPQPRGRTCLPLADQAIGMLGRHRNNSGMVEVALQPKIMYHMDVITIIEVESHCGTVLKIEEVNSTRLSSNWSCATVGPRCMQLTSRRLHRRSRDSLTV